MRVARLIAGVALLASVATAAIPAKAGGVGRFRPATPDYVVLRVPASASRDPIALLEQRRAREPHSEAIASALAELYLARARAEREPRYFARAEALLRHWVTQDEAAGEGSTPNGAGGLSDASGPSHPGAQPSVRASTLRVQADILQNRHDFAGALRLLDRAIALAPRDAGARLMRASVKMVGGHAAEARADCAAVLAAGDSTTGTICLSQVLAATGSLARADGLLKTLVSRDQAGPATPWEATHATLDQPPARSAQSVAGSAKSAGPAPSVRAWALWLLADFADRAGDTAAAEAYLRAALEADPQSEGIRAALSDLLLSRGAYREALALVDLPAPSIGLLARRARAQQLLHDSGLAETRSQIDELVQLATRRGDPPHLREEALVALDVDHDAPRALELAKANFETQRETIDLRLVIRAARACEDSATLRSVAQWVRATRYEDRALTQAATLAETSTLAPPAATPRAASKSRAATSSAAASTSRAAALPAAPVPIRPATSLGATS